MIETELAQLKASVEAPLKKQAFALLALRGMPYKEWLREQLQTFVAENDVQEAWRQCGVSSIGEDDGQ